MRTAHAAVFAISAVNEALSVGALRYNGRSWQQNKIQLDLATMECVHDDARGPIGYFGQLLNTTLPDGREFLCLNCDEELFDAWVSDTFVAHVTTDADSSVADEQAERVRSSDTAGKHPSSPGYADWTSWNEKHHTAALATPSAGQVAKGGGLRIPQNHPVTKAQVVNLEYGDLEGMKSTLKERWRQRQLVVGAGQNPDHKHMDFVEILVHLGQSAPTIVNPKCKNGEPNCGTLLSGLKPAATSDDLRHTLSDAFGDEFLKKNEFDASLDEAALRGRIKSLLAAMKHSYMFYRQGCLAQEISGNGKCDQGVTSKVIGQMACSPDQDDDTHDCVYAELRRCDKSCTNNFFEYARFHGPLALFGTRQNRGWVMGQCEEFSRAAFAMLSSLGYDARYVLDFTDHVWIEVKLPKVGNQTNVWLHADPSEGVLDSPKMYERGWGKKLSMIFAFTPWSVEHVTARYTDDYDGTIQRRGINEEVLQAAVDEANSRLKNELPKTEWGFAVSKRSADRSLEEIALWSHFEAN